MLVVDWIYPLHYIRNVKLMSSLYPQVSGHSCTPFYPCRSCKFMVTCIASPKGPQHDLCTLLYVADDRKRKRKTNKPVKKTMQWKKKGKERGCEWGDRIVFKIYWILYLPFTRASIVSVHICHTNDQKKKRFTWNLTHSLVTWVIVFQLQQGDMWLCFFPPQFSPLGNYMTHRLPVLLHLQAHICLARIKQNGSTIKWLWQLSSHTS